jgi:4-diphosphocytidyl-2-C-methyl-D-erythritol kinase
MLSPAKLNLSLRVVGQRPDGFHDIDTLMVKLPGLADEITIVSSNEFSFSCSDPELPTDNRNLVVKAVEALSKKSGQDLPFQIHLEKHIPHGAGLGGGSSNAATTLLALNNQLNNPLPAEELHSLATELGSDVPFFLMGGTVAAGGRGEQLVPLPDTGEQQTLVLLYPNFALRSRDAYALGQWDNCDEEGLLTGDTLDTTMQRLFRALDPKEDSWPLLENDFENALFTHYPILVKAKSALESAGCKRVMLCGSGSTLLGFGSIRPVKKTADYLLKQQIGEVFICKTLSGDQYRTCLTNSGLNDV